MKKIFTLLAFAACCAAAAWSCSDEYDDSGLRQEIADIRQEIASMKEQVNSLKTLVDALNGNKFITNYTESDDGWSITFNDGKTITIRDGEKGADAPVLGIARFEGVYYWTLGGADEWLLDDAGSKIPVGGRTAKPLRSTRRAIGRSTASRSKVPTADRSRRSAKTAIRSSRMYGRPTTR